MKFQDDISNMNTYIIIIYLFLLFILVSQIRSIKHYNKILNTHLKYIYNILKFAKSHGLLITTQDDTKKRK